MHNRRMPVEARAIIHVDMDAYYASVEQLDNPALRGRPVIVGGLGTRGVVSTCSYEARPYGVRSAMPIAQARRLCPDGVYVLPRMERYQELSEVVFDVFHQVTPQIEGLSLDEAFLDVTASLRLFDSVESIGRRIKSEIFARTGLHASVGMAQNKLLAKLASELSKPDGFLRIDPEGAQACLDPLPVGRLWTVGKVAEQSLHRIGVRTIGELVRCDPWRLQRAVGKHGEFLQALARGEDEREVQSGVAEQSIGAERTFDIDLSELSIAQAWLLQQCEKVAARARGRDMRPRTVTVKLREPPFVTHTRQAQLASPDNATPEIYALARRLLDVWWQGQPRPRLRLIGVSLSGFGQAAVQQQQDMFAVTKPVKKADGVQDRINERFGAGSLFRAGVLKTRGED
jgi:DNA polymerase IV